MFHPKQEELYQIDLLVIPPSNNFEALLFKVKLLPGQANLSLVDL